MSNGKFGSGSRASSTNLINVHNQFLEEQLTDAQHSLFFAKSVKEAKFLQNRIDYLRNMLKVTNGRKTVSR